MKKQLALLLSLLCVIMLSACTSEKDLRKAEDLATEKAEEANAIREKYNSVQSELSALKEELQQTKDTLAATEESLNEISAKYEKEHDELLDLRAEVASYSARYKEEDLEEYLSELNKASSDVDALKETIQKEQDRKKAEAAKKAAEEAKKRAQEETEKAGDHGAGITYENLARTPDKYKQKKVAFDGMVIECVERNGECTMLLAVHKTNGKYDDSQILYCVFKPSIISYRLLDKDVVTVYGTSTGIKTYQAVSGRTMQIPSVKVDKIELNK